MQLTYYALLCITCLMYLYKFGAGHQGRNSNLAALHESDSGPMELTELKEIPHNRTGILLHNVRLNPQETRKERTHGHLSVLCIMTATLIAVWIVLWVHILEYLDRWWCRKDNGERWRRRKQTIHTWLYPNTADTPPLPLPYGITLMFHSIATRNMLSLEMIHFSEENCPHVKILRVYLD